MRISTEHRQALRQHFLEALGDGCDILVFGSRLDDASRGGDVDLLVRSPVPLQRKEWTASLLAVQAQRLLGGRQVDVLLVDPQTPLQAVHKVALETGVAL
jgi:hypothetical protein